MIRLARGFPRAASARHGDGKSCGRNRIKFMRYRSETTINQFTGYAYKTVVLQSGWWRRCAACEGGFGANRTRDQIIEPEQAGVNLGTAFCQGPGFHTRTARWKAARQKVLGGRLHPVLHIYITTLEYSSIRNTENLEACHL